ncbi:MAG: pyridoxal phosphate-dependent aminotransferase [Lachnospiraceae bacterium]|nr:pyridoxal phosphate-dependent aminotransferase [Lachnospiraceae bacterium]
MFERNLDFDKIIERRNTDSLKYDFAVKRHRPADVLPLWVAEMDFRISSYIQDALVKQVEHGIYGYTDTLDDYYESVHGWFLRHHNFDIKEEWIIKTPGIVYALGMAVQAYTNVGEAVIIQQPVYYPFSEVVRYNGRRLLSNNLVYDPVNNRYVIDFVDFEQKVESENVKLFLFCSPHNPVGRAWDKEELAQLLEICRRHGVIIFSDEIHCDFVWEKKHIVLASIAQDYQDHIITATSPSKTFNIPGLQVSNIIIPGTELRKVFQNAVNASGYSQLNAVGLIATKAAYAYAEEWHAAVSEYIRSNIAFMRAYLKEYLPMLNMVEVEATYLPWVDCSGLGLSDRQLDELIIKEAHLWLDPGHIFGEGGHGYQRFNAACPKSVLLQALSQLREAIEKTEAGNEK